MKSFHALQLDKSYQNLFEILWNTQVPCFDVKNVTSDFASEHGLLKSCSWKGIKMPCSAIFKVLTQFVDFPLRICRVLTN